MANIREILNIEHQRETSESWRTIYLYKEGRFYRAYQVSAWLYSCALKTIRRLMLERDDFWRVGCFTRNEMKWCFKV